MLHHSDTLKKYAVMSLSIVGLTCYLLFMTFNPLGLKSDSLTWSRQYFLHIYDFFNSDINLSEFGSKVSVVRIDDKFVRENGEEWPVSFNLQARLLQQIASYDPDAVYIDWTLSKERQGMTAKEFSDVLARYPDIQFFMHTPDSGYVLADLAEHFQRVYGHTENPLNYLMQDKRGKPRAALEIYRTLCSAGTITCESDVFEADSHIALFIPEAVWTGKSEYQACFDDETCKKVLLDCSNGNCQLNVPLTASMLVNSGNSMVGLSDEFYQAIEHELSGKVVFLLADMAATTNYIKLNNIPDLPSNIVHPIALSNLMSLGDNVLKVPGGLFNIPGNQLIQFMFIAATLMIFHKGLLQKSCLTFVLLLLITSVFTLVYFVLTNSVINYIGLIVFLIPVAVIKHPFFCELFSSS